MLREDEKFRSYMPEPTAEGRLPDRTYFWNVANTVQHNYVQEAIKHATNLRMTGQAQ
jgi:hypothetical protein